MDYSYMHPAEQIVETIGRIYRHKMTTTSGGNLSVLDESGNIWITPSGIDKGSLTPADICCVKPDGTVIGKYKPSVEFPFHKHVYETRRDAKAVLHAHPPALVSYSLLRKNPETRALANVYALCGKVGIAAYAVPGSLKLGENIAARFGEGCDVVMMENHGAVCCAGDIFQAFKKFETFEKCALLDITARLHGKIHVLDQAQLEYGEKFFTTKCRKSIDVTAAEKLAMADMCKMAKRSYEQDLFTSAQGVLSQRTDGAFLVTPCGGDNAYLTSDEIIKIPYGEEKTPLEKLFAAIYYKHSDINAIALAQPINAMAFAVTDKKIDSKTIPESYIMIRDMLDMPFGSDDDPDFIAGALSECNPVATVANSYVLTTGKTLLNAFDRLEVTEFTAKTLIRAGLTGQIVIISPDEVREIEKDFHLLPANKKSL